MHSQELKTHQWKNRIILVISNNAESADFSHQIDQLKNHSIKCAERKLVMYQIVPNEVHSNKFDGAESEKWNSASDLYTEFMKKDDSFKMVLIGLDGTVKEERLTPIAPTELFQIIDGMSMRQEEMKKN